ncbi:unnamed protein product [Rotaria sp. Silwood2]|nr:unnamed protein product [Rotaria sp. Silwood2]CAF2920855.1 unnamed protein product [Rotaria sp. Silwood2]CAF3297025.1 unnamed protein product [Rotaria sp. Silwood2]CAF3402542.1 unnamed protein product [Rotaria sp. Silwood2]CAF4302445.1 unnamed protein product [Rotaria sp. Silwood2]
MLRVYLPSGQDFLHVLTPQISTIEPGHNATVTFAVSAPASSPIQSYNIRCAIVDEIAQVSVGISIHLIIVGSNTTTARIKFLIEDEFTYFAANHPLVANASLTITNPNMNFHIQLFGNSSGRIEALLVPAVYEVRVQASKHRSVSRMITIDLSSDGTEWPIFLQRQLVSYQWTVTPTEVEQEYTFTLEAIFETHVPAPVVTMTPSVLSLDDMENGLLDRVDLLLTNHGYIRADNIQIRLPNSHPFLKFRILQQPIGNIEANSSILVTLVIERFVLAHQRMALSQKTATVCFRAFMTYEYDCNGVKTVSVPVPVFQASLSIMVCVGIGDVSGGGGIATGDIDITASLQMSLPCEWNPDRRCAEAVFKCACSLISTLMPWTRVQVPVELECLAYFLPGMYGCGMFRLVLQQFFLAIM